MQSALPPLACACSTVPQLQHASLPALPHPRLPPGALQPDGSGRTLLSRWVTGHMEGMAARAEARASAQEMLRAPLE